MQRTATGLSAVSFHEEGLGHVHHIHCVMLTEDGCGDCQDCTGRLHFIVGEQSTKEAELQANENEYPNPDQLDFRKLVTAVVQIQLQTNQVIN